MQPLRNCEPDLDGIRQLFRIFQIVLARIQCNLKVWGLQLGMAIMNRILKADFDWQRCPDAGRLVTERVEAVVADIPFASHLRDRMLNETGTRLMDWVDHLCLPANDPLSERVSGVGYDLVVEGPKETVWRHPGALLPTIRVFDGSTTDVCLKVESVSDFLQAHSLAETAICGVPMAPFRAATVARSGRNQMQVVERHGTAGFDDDEVSGEFIEALLDHDAAFCQRQREFCGGDTRCDEDPGFDHALELIKAASNDLGTDRACDLFFKAERNYWQSRNHAATVQKKRQDSLGLGWANHDHHTYRSSREHFGRLIELLEQIGFACRERFYGGADAGWGAQVLEQPHAGIVIFADVDLSATEMTGDFAHDGLSARDELGTVGLWCRLHGEAIMKAGMHHLECQFEFDAARSQLASIGIDTMKPFTDFEHLKQAFTVGEVWGITRGRAETLLQDGVISAEQFNHFIEQGSVGSHLEILQRDDGYKGFNQTGISEIIRATDPRHRRIG